MASRSFGPTVGLGLAGATLAAVAGSKEWATASADAAGVAVHAVATGSESAPLATALGLVALAAWGVVLVTRGRIRQVVAAVGALASAGVLVATVLAFRGARDVALEAAAARGAVGDGGAASLTGWYWCTAVGAVVAAVCFLVAVRVSPGWPAMGSKYDAPGARPEEARASGPTAEQDMWRALDEGHDPTA
jgi:uncharacterized membrane protein (TIGR02234 family)